MKVEESPEHTHGGIAEAIGIELDQASLRAG
jgi:hypothetical protein